MAERRLRIDAIIAESTTDAERIKRYWAFVTEEWNQLSAEAQAVGLSPSPPLGPCPI